MNCVAILENYFLSTIIVFHAQQAVEKCFKAIIEENDLKLDRIHNLFKLHLKIENHINFEVDVEMMELLDKVYTSSRYPLDIDLLPDGKPKHETSKVVYRFAKSVFEKTIEMLRS